MKIDSNASEIRSNPASRGRRSIAPASKYPNALTAPGYANVGLMEPSNAEFRSEI